jgi:(2Fe-2S) ferredoxin
MSRFEHLIFVCTNVREPGDARGCCHAKQSPAILDRLKELVHEHKLKGRVRATSSGCLDLCALGPAVAIFSRSSPAPETWYVHVQPADVDELFLTHILKGERLARLVRSVT